MENVAIIGASAKPDRYSHKAQLRLTEHGHKVFLVTPSGGDILGHSCYKSATEITEKIDTVTLYVGPQRLAGIINEVINLNPKRIIFNPGTEDSELMKKVKSAGIEVVEACTLVMLATDQY